MTNRIQVRDNHFVLLGGNGDELMTSKEYADEAGARRAAANLHEKLCSGDVSLETATVERTGRGKSSVEKWTRDEVLSEGGAKRGSDAGKPVPSGEPVSAQPLTISVPEPGKSAHANSPYAQ